MKDILDLVGRIFLSVIFFHDAIDSLWYFGATKEKMEDFGLVWQQDFLLGCTIFLLLFGGMLILLGYRSSFGAVLILLYWIPVTFVAHSFWNDIEPFRRLEAQIFMRNLAIIGGLLMVLVNGSGKYSVKRLLATTKVRQRID